MKLVNRPKQLKCAIIIDELTSLYHQGVDYLMATCKGMKISTCVSFHTFSQLWSSYSNGEAMAIANTAGNIFAGRAADDETAKKVAEYSGGRLAPASIANLPQGTFVGSTIGDDRAIERKIFYAAITVDANKIEADKKKYIKIPTVAPDDKLNEMVDENFKQIKTEVAQIIEDELSRIRDARNTIVAKKILAMLEGETFSKQPPGTIGVVNP
jgi:hypothetical protein